MSSLDLIRSRSQPFAIRQARNRELHLRQVEHSRYAVAMMSAFFPEAKSGDLAQVFKSFDEEVKGGKSLREAFGTLEVSLRQKIQGCLGSFLGEIFSLAQNPNEADFFAGAVQLGVRVRQNGNEATAAAILKALSQEEAAPVSIRQQATQEYQATAGEGDAMRRLEVLIGETVQPSSYRGIAPIIVGAALGQIAGTAMLGQLAKASANFFTRKLGARLVSGMASFLVEAPVMAAGAAYLAGENSFSLGEGIWEAGLGLTVMRAFGFVGREAFLGIHRVNEWGAATRLTKLSRLTRVGLPQAAMFGGMYSQHLWEDPRAEATAGMDTLKAMWDVQVGTKLGRSMLGRGFAKLQAELRARTESSIRSATGDSAKMHIAMPAFGTASVGGILPSRSYRQTPGSLLESVAKPFRMVDQKGSGEGGPPEIVERPVEARISLSTTHPLQSVLMESLRELEMISPEDGLYQAARAILNSELLASRVMEKCSLPDSSPFNLIVLRFFTTLQRKVAELESGAKLLALPQQLFFLPSLSLPERNALFLGSLANTLLEGSNPRAHRTFDSEFVDPDFLVPRTNDQYWPLGELFVPIWQDQGPKTPATILDFLESTAFDSQRLSFEFSVDGRLQPEHLRRSLHLPYEISMVEQDGTLVFISGRRGGPGGNPARSTKRNNSLLNLHSHNITTGKASFTVPSLQDALQAGDITNPKTPLIVVHEAGVTLYQKPQWDFIDRQPWTEPAWKLVDKFLIAHGYNPLRSETGPLNNIFDAEEATYFQLAKEFAEKSGMIVLTAEWDDAAAMAEMMDIINLVSQTPTLRPEDSSLVKFDSPPALSQVVEPTFALAPLPSGVNFYDIDWYKLFREYLHCNYEGPVPESDFDSETGMVNVEKIEQREGIGVRRYFRPDHTPDVDKIVHVLNEEQGSILYRTIFFAVSDPTKLNLADRERVITALSNHCNRLLGRGAITDLFSCIEVLFPVFFEAFQILEDKLPKVLKRGYLEKMPVYLRGRTTEGWKDNMKEVRAAIERQFPGEDVDELCELAKQNVDSIAFLQTISSALARGGLMLLKSEVIRKKEELIRTKLLGQ